MEQLHSFAESDTRVLMLYGRAGMGKTALLKEFLRSHNGLYYSAYATTAKRELLLFGKAIRGDQAPSEDPKLEFLLTELDRRIEATGKQEEGFCLCIDGYASFAKADASFAKILHDHVKEKWAGTKNKLILCEDSYLNAQKLMLSPGAVWQDFDGVQMELKAMNFYEANRFFMDALPEEKVLYYGITGGIPYYLNQVRSTVDETLETLVFDNTNQSGVMPEKHISAELREMSYYNCMLETLASGKNRVNQISAEVEKPKDVVVPYLTTLINIGVVKKENPITEKNNRKKTRYSIVNMSDVFWYRYIVPHMDAFFEGEMMKVWETDISPNMRKYLQQVFIEMCRDYLLQRSRNDDLDFRIDEIGKWWENDDEKKTTEGFDVVALGEMQEQQAILFARCFYKDRPIEMADLKELIDLTRHLKQKENVYYVIFSKSGFHKNAQTAASAIRNIVLISLEEVCSWNKNNVQKG